MQFSRRDLLRGLFAVAGLAGAGSLAGCDLFDGSTPDETVLSPELAALLAQTVALGDAYDGAISRVPSLECWASTISGRPMTKRSANHGRMGLAMSVIASNSVTPRW